MAKKNFINEGRLDEAVSSYATGYPFDHCIVDDFLTEDVLSAVRREFPPYESENWLVYDNKLEHKKTCNDWNRFGEVTYSLFEYLNSSKFVRLLSKYLSLPLIPDYGLHGGGLHSHSVGGNLNPHMDYSIHPKLGLQRVINLIIYVSDTLEEHNGGYLGLWEHDHAANKPGLLSKNIQPVCNRAVIFNTTQNSWHGMSSPLKVSDDTYRNSLAVYYLQRPKNNTVSGNKRAMFAPRESQVNDTEISELINLRLNPATSHLAYRKK
jgi:Rps23 Pro-64 3,4-dihydroxylase Tpa1-like proline 4-hydroxylase